MRIHDRALLPRPTKPDTAAPKIADSVPRAGVPPAAAGEDPFPCDRCGTEMFRMHAVWRCPGCGFKTDCCGW